MTTIVPAFAGIVSAHHSNIAASVECSGTVSWTATSWSTGAEGTNPDIRVKLTVNGTTSEIAQGHFDSANNYQFSGTFQWPAGADIITVSSIPVGVWGNGAVSNQGGSVDVSKPANCPNEPSVTQAVSCSTPSAGHGDGTVVLTLSNPAGALGGSVTFNVYPLDQPAGTPTAYPVATGQTTQVTFSGIADGSHTVKIIVGGVDKSQTFTVDCDSPIPATKVDVMCANGDGDVTVTLSNTGGEAVVFDVTNPKDNSIEHVTVGPDSSTTRKFTGFADGDYTVKIMVGRTDLSKPFTVACDQAGAGTISVTSACVDHDGQVTITLIATGGNQPVIFVVNGQSYSVAPGTQHDVVISGLNDGSTPISVTANGKDLSFVASSSCDVPPTYSFAHSCSNFDDTVTVTINNPGDDVAVTFTLNGLDHSVAPGTSQTVVFDHLADGQNSITLAINGVSQPNIVVTSLCDATSVVAPVCNTVDTSGTVTTYWYTITNSATTSISITWNNGGSATIAAGQSIVVGSTSAILTVQQGEAVIGQATASTATCLRDVTVTKVLQGKPATGETYTITVSRLVGSTYVPVTTFDLAAGGSVTLHLPSTLNPAGIDYKVEETNKGTATVSAVSPDQLHLSGNVVGEAVAVTVTNGYASVRIDKTTASTSVLPGEQITYTLQALNTGGLVLNPVVVTDRLPATVEFVSAVVANNGGVCSLVQATRPQLISCTMNGSLAPGVSTNPISVVVKVDADISPGLTIVNQARVHGAYEGTSDLAQNVNSTGSAGAALSCTPLIPDSVCNLSAAVGVPVTLSQSSPPTPASSSQVVVQLPRTGASNLGEMLTFGFGAVLLGGVLLLSKRRIGAR
ncbi:MAG TPA: LPXTG cell wall anchor domain-containing protein [Ilumatobacteraceae bacterium]|nr:LPXTG cell wall anchor domain-containing protein [Ilumatobacteraceae bacterium]